LIKQWPTNMPDEHSKWKREISAGGVVFKIGDGSAAAKASADRGIFILLIMPMGRNYVPPEGYWTFPKGKIDDGEEKSVAALREVKEETGVTAKILEDLSYVKFFRNYDQTLKFVHYFLMEYISGELVDHDREVAEVKWIKLEEVESMLKWPHDKQIFEKAKKVLKSS